MALQSVTCVQTGRDGVLSRRSFLRSVAVAGSGLGVLGWQDAVALQAQELRRQGRACILLFLRGGASQFETFDPKPGTSTGGPTQAIQTAVSSIRIADSWPNLAQAMGDVALIRSMTNREGEHQRATYQMHTGYIPVGGVRFPTLGSIVARETLTCRTLSPSAGVGAGLARAFWAWLTRRSWSRTPTRCRPTRRSRRGSAASASAGGST